MKSRLNIGLFLYENQKNKAVSNSICEYHRKEEKKISIIRIHLTIKTHQRTHKIF